MELPVGKTRFVSVDYPAIVQNEDNMLKTIGGTKGLEKAYGDSSRRLELLWRPNDIFCKPVFGDLKSVTRLVLKVKRKKKKGSASKTINITGEDCDDSCEGEIIGTISSAYKFNSMADFQYLPMKKVASSAPDCYKSTVGELCVEELQPRSWLDHPAPSHMLPPIFSRIDTPTDYCFRDDPLPKQKEKCRKPLTSAPNFIGGSRKRRPHFTVTMDFMGKDVPECPFPEAQSREKTFIAKRGAYVIDAVKQAFEECPIWSKNEIAVRLAVPREQLKVVLSACAYYWISGPWRTMWCRFGYDPRKDQNAKIYQALDFRLRTAELGSKLSYSKIKAKRSMAVYTLPLTKVKTVSRVALIRHERQEEGQDSQEEDRQNQMKEESTFIFRPGILPPYRQMFYQLKYIEVDEIQRMVHANDGQETVCTEKDGWLLMDTLEKSRALMTSLIKTILNPSDDRNLVPKILGFPFKGMSGRQTKNVKTTCSSKSSAGVSEVVITAPSSGGTTSNTDQGETSTDQGETSTAHAQPMKEMGDEATEGSDGETDDDDDEEEEEYNAMEEELLELATGLDGDDAS